MSLLIACGSPSGNGASQLISNGASPASVAEPDQPIGGRIDVARARFLGTSLNSSLVGAAESFDASGNTLVVGNARFAYPTSSVALRSGMILPAAPERMAGEQLRCQMELGPVTASSQLPGVPVDVGDRIRVQGVTAPISFALLRRPLLMEDVIPASLRYEYLERVLSRTIEETSTTNWVAGSKVMFAFSGAGPTDQADLARHPVASALEGELSLPRALLDVALQGDIVLTPTHDPISSEVVPTGQTFALPYDGTPLQVGWTPWDDALSLVISLEYYGPGAGRCPSGCSAEGDCCREDAQCRSTEHCEERPDSGRRTCLPEYGVGSDRLGAIVCSAQDTGSMALASSYWSELEHALEITGKLGLIRQVVLRVGRSVEANLESADIMLPDATRQSMSPLRARAVDLVLIPLSREGR